MSTKQTTMNEILSATDFSSQLNINLSNMQEVANSIKGVMDNGQLNNVGDIASSVSPDKLRGMIEEQTKMITCALNSMSSTSILGQDNMQSTLNAALSTVMGTMASTLANMQNSMSQISKLSQQVESIKSSLKNGNIDELKKEVK